MIKPIESLVNAPVVNAPVGSKDTARRACTRDQLLDAACRVIERTGPSASMQEMAAEAGITKPILYRHFGDKAGLLRALALRSVDIFEPSLASVWALKAPLEERINIITTRFGSRAVIATSDDPEASARISRFARSDTPWIVAVRMVSEGVDIPRLRVGVFATNTTTELFFRQAVGRLVRWTPGAGRQRSFLFIPDDVRLRAHAHQLADSRRHSLRKRSEDLGLTDSEPDPAALDTAGEPEQLSLFAALSATPIGAPEFMVPLGEDLLAAEMPDSTDSGNDQGPGLLLDLAPLPTLAGQSAESVPDRRAARKALRDLNAAVAAELVARTAQTHAQVNAELNRRAGIPRVTEATNAQLQTRLDRGRRWLDDLRRR